MIEDVQERVPQLVMPGDIIEEAQALAKQNIKVILGPGVQRNGDKVFACKSGVLVQSTVSSLFVRKPCPGHPDG